VWVPWVTVFSPNDISGLRRPKSIRFGTKVELESSTGIMHTLRFLEKVYLCVKMLNDFISLITVMLVNFVMH